MCIVLHPYAVGTIIWEDLWWKCNPANLSKVHRLLDLLDFLTDLLCVSTCEWGPGESVEDNVTG